MNKKFWIVMGPNGMSTRPYRHQTESDAFKEAERLCRIYEGKFVVLEAKGAAQRIDVVVSRFDDGIPF